MSAFVRHAFVVFVEAILEDNVEAIGGLDESNVFDNIVVLQPVRCLFQGSG